MICMMDSYYQCYGGVLITQGQEVLGIRRLQICIYLLVMEAEINKKQVIERLLNDGSTEEAFRSMMYENQNKIPGIGISTLQNFCFL